MIRSIEIEIAHKIHDNGLRTIRDLKIHSTGGEFVSIVGPSGAGKTTLLRILSGLDRDVNGSIRINGTDTGLWEQHPRIGYVFQEPRLMPWLTVRENLELVAQSDAEGAHIDTLLDQVGMDQFNNAYPAQLSGGMQRRVALARAFLGEPQLLLLDEPFQSLDEPTANSLRALLLSLWQQQGPTVFFVTHQLREAVTLADRIVFVSKRPATVILDHRLPPDRTRDVASDSTSQLCAELLQRHPLLLSGDAGQ